MAMDARKLAFSQPSNSYIGFNLADTLKSFHSIRSPESCPRNRTFNTFSQSLRDCSLESCINPIIKSQEDHVSGLLLQEYLPVS